MVLLLATVLISLGFGSIQTIDQAMALKFTEHCHMSLTTATYCLLCDLSLGVSHFIYGFWSPTLATEACT
jgi:hypothetical protein